MIDTQYDEFESCHPMIGEAVGYADLGLWEAAEAKFQELPVEVQLQPGLHRLRLRICAAVEDFREGPMLAFSGILQDPEDLEAAGRYLLGMARYYFDREDLQESMACQAACCAIWPECGMRPVLIPDLSPENMPVL